MAGVVRNVPSHSNRSSGVVKAPRPPNAWIIYRSDKIHQLPPLEPGQPRRVQAEISKMISNLWANEPEETRQAYERRAEEAKAAHALKYPGYRFKPMKREDKRLQRELEEKKRREQQRKPSPNRVSVPPVPFTPIPQYYMQMHTPINLSHLSHSIPTSLPFSFQSYYPSQARYGPAGPTPPVSAAASPNDPSPSPEPTTHIDEPREDTTPAYRDTITTNMDFAQQSQQHTASPATNTHTTLSMMSNPYPPSFNSTGFASGQEWPQTHEPVSAATTATNNGTLTPAITPRHMWQELPSNTQQQVEQNGPSSSQVMASETVSFEINSLDFQNVLHSSADALSGLVSTTSDPTVFNLNIDSNQLLDHPTGEIEVSVGHFAPLDFNTFPPDFYQYCDPYNFGFSLDGNPQLGYFMQPGMDGAVDLRSADDSSSGNITYNPDDYLDFGPSMGYTETIRPPTSVSEAAPTPPMPYVPPTGAGNSSYRRVGGSWNKHFGKSPTPSPTKTLGMTYSHSQR